MARNKRIENRINIFLENWETPFTVNDVMESVKWDGSRKHLSRFLVKHPRIMSIGKRKVAGQMINLYMGKSQAQIESGLYGRE
jgi:hypothetical protein